MADTMTVSHDEWCNDINDIGDPWDGDVGLPKHLTAISLNTAQTAYKILSAVYSGDIVVIQGCNLDNRNEQD